MRGCELSNFVVLNASVSCDYRFGFALVLKDVVVGLGADWCDRCFDNEFVAKQYSFFRVSLYKLSAR